MKSLTLFSIFLFSIFFSFSQTENEKHKIISKTKVKELNKMSFEFEKKYKSEKAKALKLADEKGWIIREDKNGKLIELMKVSEEGNPIYYTTYNVDAAASTRADWLHNGGGLGINIEGQAMTAYVWDGGLARSTHQEYDGTGGTDRFSIGDGTTTLHYHAAHVTGTIIASGYVANAKGMAPQAYAIGYDWNSDISEATTAAAEGMLLSNHSYGWDAASIPDWYFGAYLSDSRDWDAIMYNAPYYLMVVAAGNDGNDNSSNGDPLDGNSSYDKLSSHATSKNNLVVANANDASIDASGNLVSVTINTSSSEGPTDDYRIKPDITGNGTGLYSTYEGSDNDYASITGTSMASPNVTGTLLLLQQYYSNLYSNNMRAATLKGLALHTADDAGTAGPDVIFGWGLLNAKEAANTITNHGNTSLISELNISQGETYVINVNSDGINDLMASISWTDPAGTANTETANDNTPALVNDLDIRITQAANTYYPYRLTSITANDNAGDNMVDPFERVDVSGASGTYTITVSHKGILTNNSQNYSMIITGIINPAPIVSSASPASLFLDKGKQITVNGSGLLGCTFNIGGITGTVNSNDGNTAVINFPAGNYTNGTLTVESGAGIDNSQSITINSRTTIPVDASALFNSDIHQTIDGAVDGLHTWLGASLFTTPYIIDVSTGTYSESISLNSELNPTAENTLTIQNNNSAPIIDATGYNYGFDLGTVDFVELKGFEVHNADLDNIYLQGNNCEILFNKSYNANNAGIKAENGTSNNIHNNLIYDNSITGIQVISSNNNTIKNNTFYNNGGIISGTAEDLYSQGFNTSGENIDPADWTTVVLVDGGGVTPAITYLTSSVPGEYPGNVSPSEGTRFVKFDNWSSEAGDELRLYQTIPISTIGYQNIQVTFDWYYGSDQYSDTEGATIQWSTDGTTWNDATFIPRYGPVSLWQNEAIILPTGANNQSSLYIAFKFHSEYLDNSHLDNLIIKGSLPVNTGSGLYVESGTGTTIENNIFVAKSGTDFVAMETASGTTLSSDYNTYYKNGNTNLVNYNGAPYVDLTSWAGNGAGLNDIESDPDFTDAIGHINSLLGYYSGTEWPPTVAAGTWLTGTDSPALDKGNPSDPYTVEPQAGGVINQGVYGNTVQASKSLSKNFIWTGSIDTDWQTTANWDISFLPSAGDDVTINSGPTNYPLIDDDDLTAVCNNLTINTGSVTIAVNGQMTVYGTLTNNAGNTGLLINSDATGTGSLMHSTANVPATVERFLDVPSGGSQYHYISSPINGAESTLFNNQLYAWDATVEWSGLTSDSDPWGSGFSGTMVNGSGYANYDIEKTVNFVGNLNQGDISLTLGNSGSGDAEFQGWNFVGNPYPSAIYWDNVTADNYPTGLEGAIYFFDDDNQSQTQSNYQYYVPAVPGTGGSGIGTSGASDHIAIGQGFFIKTTNTAVNLTLKDVHRTHSNNPFYKGKETQKNLLRLFLQNENYIDEMVLRMLPDGTNGFDAMLDARKRFSAVSEQAAIYSISDDGLIAINTLPIVEDSKEIIPIGLYIGTSGEYTLSFIENNFSEFEVYLHDIQTDIYTQLSVDNPYVFTSEAGTYTDRFELVFEKSSSDIESLMLTDILIYPNPTGGTFWLTIGNQAKNYSVEIHNITGQTVYKNEFINSGTKEIQLNNQSAGVYFIKIIFDNNYTVNKKIIIQ